MATEDLPRPPHHPRPTGVVQPEEESTVRAMRALERGRLREAEKCIDLIPDSEPVDRSWKLFLQGLLAVERGDFASAEPLLLQVASQASHEGEASQTPVDLTMLRLSARALEKAGWIYRRQDRPDDAYRTHRLAYDIRAKHGSFEELWEIATSLGLDADLARRYEDGQAWHRVAIEAGGHAAQQPQRSQAVAWTNLAASLTNTGLHDAAVDAARTARSWWHKHDIAAVSAARADMNLGGTLLKQGEALHGSDPQRAGAILDEAIEWIRSSREALLAFGPDNAVDATCCDQQADFARRLREALNAPDDTGSTP